MRKIKSYQFVNHGMSEDAICVGKSYKFDYVTTGSGKTMSLALADCLDMVELRDFEIKILEEQLSFLKDDTETDSRFHVTIFWS